MSTICDRYGPWALVAGASEGIGAAFAAELAAAGFGLVLVARRPEPLEALARELRTRTAAPIDTLALDLAADDLESQLRDVLRTRDIGLLVYNAALSIVAPFLDTSLADKQRMLDVNARGPLIAAHVCGEHFAARGRGGIVLLSSLTAFWGSAWVATYGATKAFNLGLGEALALELAEHGVDVVVSCVGATRTPGFVSLMAGRKAPRSMSPADVARETLAALPKRGAFIPGRWNRLAQQLLVRVLPRRAAVEIMASQTKPLL
ncbi:MAG TPA: SDR family NAD(P)-dependent oxidoreductase [Polyangiales bacterium]|nr:SDR family NAD(P)-dependent oxidoreductase [Polyangiales bacterium]